MGIQAVIFDLDGVITDTAVYHYESWFKIGQKFGYELTLEDNEKLKGVSRSESLELILKWSGQTLNPQDKEALLVEKNQHYLELIARLSASDILPGVIDFLDDLDLNSCLKAVGSSSKNAISILDKLGLINRFNTIIDGNQVNFTKPDPEVFIKASESLKVSPQSCLVIEDALAGIKAAKSAGMKCIGIGHDLKEADLILPDLIGLKFTTLKNI